jgi:uncharacterized membrane protein
MNRFIKKAGLWAMTVLAAGVALVSLRFFFLSFVQASGPEFGAHLAKHGVLFLLHAGGGLVALLVGAWQFFPKLRGKYLSLHRLIGRVYVVAILIGGISGLFIALRAFGGIIAQLGFSLLAVCWLVTTTMAFLTIRRKEVQKHREWMIRSYALTFAAATLRVWLPLLQVVGLSFVSSYRIVAWLAWVPNLLLVEWFIANRLRQKKSAPQQIKAPATVT